VTLPRFDGEWCSRTNAAEFQPGAGSDASLGGFARCELVAPVRTKLRLHRDDGAPIGVVVLRVTDRDGVPFIEDLEAERILYRTGDAHELLLAPGA